MEGVCQSPGASERRGSGRMVDVERRNVGRLRDFLAHRRSDGAADSRGSSVNLRRAGHELVDHTSEVVVRLRAPSFSDLVEEAAYAFLDLVPDRLRGPEEAQWKEIRVRGSDHGALLVNWLNELVFQAEVERWVPVEIQVDRDQGSELRIRARGLHLDAPFVLVKAATLHDLDLRQDPSGFEGEVTLDV
jgi:SHS2 domain-containing protein